jgi:hypothetical protein
MHQLDVSVDVLILRVIEYVREENKAGTEWVVERHPSQNVSLCLQRCIKSKSKVIGSLLETSAESTKEK